MDSETRLTEYVAHMGGTQKCGSYLVATNGTISAQLSHLANFHFESFWMMCSIVTSNTCSCVVSVLRPQTVAVLSIQAACVSA